MASQFKVFQVDQDLDDLSQILRGKTLHQSIADLSGKKVVQCLIFSVSSPCQYGVFLVATTHVLQCVINHIRMRKVVICKKVELVQEISNVDAAQGIHP